MLEGRDLELLNAFRQATHALSRPPQGQLIDNYFAVQREKARVKAFDLAMAISHMIDVRL